MYKFENLLVWKESFKLCKLVYVLCNKLPGYESRGLCDQIRRSSTSILINISEGTGAESDQEFLRFLSISKKSLYETVAILKLIEDLHQIDVSCELSQISQVGKLLNGLINKLKRSDRQ